MPTRLPNSVHEAWGEQAAEDFSQWIEEYLQERTVRRDEYREVLSRLDVIDERFKRVDARFEQVDERFEQVDARFEQLDERLNRMGEHFENRFDQMDQRFNQIDQRFDNLSAQFDQRLDSLSEQFNDRIDRLHEQTRVMMRWTVGTIALFGTIVTVLLAIAEFGG